MQQQSFFRKIKNKILNVKRENEVLKKYSNSLDKIHFKNCFTNWRFKEGIFIYFNIKKLIKVFLEFFNIFDIR